MSKSPLSPRPSAGRLLLAPLAACVALGTFAGLPAPAAAQYYSPYYDDGPFYAPPRIYRYRPPDYERFSPQDVRPMLRSMGFSAIATPRVTGNAFVTEATDSDGVRLRVRIDRYSGRVLSMRPLGNGSTAARGGVPVPPGEVKLPPKKPAPPQTAALPPTSPAEPPVPPEPARPVQAAKPSDAAKPSEAAAKPSETARPTETAGPSETAKPSEAIKPSEPKAAEAPEAPAPARQAAIPPTGGEAAPKPAETPVRVIPGVAVPNQPAPAQQAPAPAQASPAPSQPAPPVVANSKVGTGAGTGTPTGSVSAGTASVLSRDAARKPTEKPKTTSN